MINFEDNNCVIREISDCKETCWINPYKLPFDMIKSVGELVVSDVDIEDAEGRLLRFAPFIQKCFPETSANRGIIESKLSEISAMKGRLEKARGCNIPGKVFLKMDSHLAVVGSIKARGGIYEVLQHAEDLALKHGLIDESDNYEKFADEKIRKFLGEYTVQVGSTGNLGLSIGIISATLGFKVKIHMSADAKQWKKDMLRKKGVEVLEYEDDYSYAVAQGRAQSDKDPKSYFVDDEKSVDLFIGYAVAAKRLKKQLEEAGLKISSGKPLVVYIPAGVGGAPGGICYGLKRVFGDAVHCFFVEPVLCPSLLLGIATQKHEKANVRDFGICGITEADGLACASPSGFATRMMTNLVSGEFTVEDAKLYDYLRMLYESEGIRIEPSSCAVFEGICSFRTHRRARRYCEDNGLTENMLNNAVQILWVTGGSLVPDGVFETYLNTYL